MKKLLVLIFSLFFLYSPSVFADDISDFQIEGMSIGDSLLDYMTEDEILEAMEETKDIYHYLNEPNKYAEIYIWNDLSIYDLVTVHVKNSPSTVYLTNKNEQYEILTIRGLLKYTEDFDGCIQKRDEIEETLSEMFPNAEKWDTIFPKSDDPSGKSITDKVYFELEEGTLQLACTNYEETFRIKNNIVNSLAVIVRTEEIRRWLLDK